jgi:hypothetical protein
MAWLSKPNANQIPLAIFYLAFETLLQVYDRKGFVCSVFCLQRAALLIAVDKLSVTLYENSSQPDPSTHEALLQETNCKGAGGLTVARIVETCSIVDSPSIPN